MRRRDPATRRGVILTAVAVIALAPSVLPSVPAQAITPPQVSPGALVRGATVGPPEPTEQRTLCAEPVAAGPQTTPSNAQQMMNLPGAWRFSRGQGQRIAVIDTGVTPHPRLPRLRGGGDYVSTGDGLSDCDAHGTLVAGIIAASPSARDGFTGVAPDASIISIRQSSNAFDAKSRRTESADATVGSGYGSVRTLAAAVVRAVDLGATVINISEVACVPAGTPPGDGALGAAVRHAYERDVVVVVAAGNLSSGSSCATQNPDPDPADTPGWGSVRTIASPAWFDDYVLAVGSVDADTGRPSGFSLHGPWVDVAAPGSGIVSLDSSPRGTGLVDAQQGDSGPLPLLGTSFAAPYVAGTVALVRARYPQLSAGEVMDRVVRTAHAPGTGHDQAIGYGVIDPVAALTAELPEEPGPAPIARIAAPAPVAPPDHTARDVALIGAGVAAAVIIAVVAASLPFRRDRRLDPDEF
ncbi:type VII secretion-associated serine protease mycosin [Gordonia desulfuricans]|uniref:Type VII secretion-associated serine protease mycosin n=1 Tax=Gordonia desulfuricans TaxID=89051 RepID=A0A7K3LLF9_9ACTN|nr:type VII secretion-associated serine protease mycosin [Gordonia desulfuricans]NDK89092.1 type VII secretion-associated serine protease mycosin [Gordonia desulfuricans]